MKPIFVCTFSYGRCRITWSESFFFNNRASYNSCSCDHFIAGLCGRSVNISVCRVGSVFSFHWKREWLDFIKAFCKFENFFPLKFWYHIDHCPYSLSLFYIFDLIFKNVRSYFYYLLIANFSKIICNRKYEQGLFILIRLLQSSQALLKEALSWIRHQPYIFQSGN